MSKVLNDVVVTIESKDEIKKFWIEEIEEDDGEITYRNGKSTEYKFPMLEPKIEKLEN